MDALDAVACVARCTCIGVLLVGDVRRSCVLCWRSCVTPCAYVYLASAATGHEANIVTPAVCEYQPQIDYEGELCVVIGLVKTCNRCSIHTSCTQVLRETSCSMYVTCV